MGLLAFVAVVVVLALAAFILVPGFLNDESETVGGGPGPVNGQDDPADPVDSAAVEDVLTPEGFECFDSVAEPVQVRTCYRTEEDGATMDVQIQADPSGDVGYVGISAASDSYWGGDAAAPFPPVYESVGEVLVGEEAQELPSLELEDEDHRSLAWGEVRAWADPESARADFFRDGFEHVKDLPDLPVDQQAALDQVTDLGYECEDSRCSKGPATGDLRRRVTVNQHGAVTAELTAQDGFEVTNEEIEAEYPDLLGVVVDGDDLETARSWLAENTDPDVFLARADVGGVHLRLQRDGTDEAELEITGLETP